MATSKERVEEILGYVRGIDSRVRAMFGEYALYVDDKVAAFVCDGTVFVKQASGQSEFVEGLDLGPCYPGSKDYWIVPEARVREADWLTEFLQATADALPAPKPRKR